MRIGWCGRLTILGVWLLGISAATATEPPAAPPPPAAGDAKDSLPNGTELTTELELRIERVVPLSGFHGQALLAAVDPRFVLVGQVSWVQKPEVLARHSQQAFAIHSPTQLGLNGWQRGNSICLLLTRSRAKDKTLWRLSAMTPDAGCRGGG